MEYKPFDDEMEVEQPSYQVDYNPYNSYSYNPYSVSHSRQKYFDPDQEDIEKKKEELELNVLYEKKISQNKKYDRQETVFSF